MSVYANGGASSGSVYAQPGASTGSVYAGGSSAPAAKKKRGGFLHGLEHAVTQTGSDLYHGAINAPGGLYQVGKLEAQAIAYDVKHPGLGKHESLHDFIHGNKNPASHKLGQLEAAQVQGVKQDFAHPLRHPGYTLLDLGAAVSAGAGGAARLAAAGRVLDEGGTIADAARLLRTKPAPPERTIRSGDLAVHPEASTNVAAAKVQLYTDKLLQHAADAKPGGRAETFLHRKIGKVLTAQAKQTERIARGPGEALIRIGSKLKPGEQKALQVVAEQAPLDQRITAAAARVTGAKDAAARVRHQGELDLLHQAQEHLTATAGRPALASPKLQQVYARMVKVAGDRETLLKSLGQLTDESIQSRKTNAARVSLGATYEKPSPSKLGKETAGLKHATRRVVSLQRRYDEELKRTTAKVGEAPMIHTRTGYKRQSLSTAPEAALKRQHVEVPAGPKIPGVPSELPVKGTYSPKLERIGGALSIAKDELRRQQAAAAARIEPTGILGQEHFNATSAAVRIPDVAAKARGLRPGAAGRVGAQGTIGHLKAPGSVTHGYTGALRENALRRQDTAQLVGESSLEAAKYAGLKHIHDLVRKTASPVPLREDDIAVRLDNLKSHDRLPLDVRKFVDDPEEFFQHATPAEKGSMLDRVRQELFINPKQLTPEARARFAELEKQGKIGWVPRRVLGEFAKPQAPLSAVVGSGPVRTFDAINNASRFAILYLKPAYAIPNLLGNAALNVLQQGFASIPNLTRAARLNAHLGADATAAIDTALGEGVAQAVSAHGVGRLSGVVDKAAQVWSKGVDVPFRRASFLYEAAREGFRTPDQLTRLVTDAGMQDTFNRVAIRANREIIDYANLSPVEREVVRRVVFFYPWVKGSTVYAGRLLREHPVKAAATARLGVIGQQEAAAQLGAIPSYLEGLIPVGNSSVINPNSAAILQTPAVLGQTLQGIVTGNIPEVAAAANYYTPALALAAAELSRTNPQTEQPFAPGTSGLDVAQQSLFNQLPQVSLVRNLKAAITGHGGSKLYPPSVQSALLQFLVGGVAPRKIDKADLLRLAALEQRNMTGR